MSGSNQKVRGWAYPKPCDLRKYYDGLSGLVREEFNVELLSGDYFHFVNRRRTPSKTLFGDGKGLVLYYRHLEDGRFACLWRDEDACDKILELIGDLSKSRPKQRNRPKVSTGISSSGVGP